MGAFEGLQGAIMVAHLRVARCSKPQRKVFNEQSVGVRGDPARVKRRTFSLSAISMNPFNIVDCFKQSVCIYILRLPIGCLSTVYKHDQLFFVFQSFSSKPIGGVFKFNISKLLKKNC